MQRKLTLNDIQNIIESRQRYYFEMWLYLNDMQKGKVVAEDIAEFFRDVAGIKLTDQKEKNDDYIQKLITLVKGHHHDYNLMKQCFTIPDKKVGICVLNKILENWVATQSIVQSANGLDASTDAKIFASIFDKKTTNLLSTEIQPYLPKENIELNLAVKVKISKKNKTHRRGNHLFFDCSNTNIHYTLNWNPLITKIAEARFNLLENITGLKVDPDEYENNPQQTWDRAHQDRVAIFIPAAGGQLEYDNLVANIYHLASKMEAEQLNIDEVEPNKFIFLKKQIELFFEYRECADKIKTILEKGTAAFNEHTQKLKLESAKREVPKKIAQIKAPVDNKLTSLSNQIAKEFDQKDESYSDNMNLIHEIQSAISENIYVQLALNEQNDIETLNEKIEQFKKAVHNDYLPQCHAIEKEIKACIAAKKAALEQEKLQQAELAKEQRQAARDKLAQLQNENKLKIQKYKESVDVLRQQKMALKKQEKPSEIKINDPEPTIAVINDDIEKILANLRTEDVDLIQSIFDNNIGIKYHDIKILITNKLGGEILETSKGSSHKRIKLQNLYSELNTHADAHAEDEEFKVETKSTGGMAKPHGHAHNSGVLSRFNIKLICKALTQAKITPENIAHCRQNNLEEALLNSNTFINRR